LGIEGMQGSRQQQKNENKIPIPKEHSTYFGGKPKEIKDSRFLSIFCKLDPRVLFQSITFFVRVLIQRRTIVP
jgi:hypothetical protein